MLNWIKNNKLTFFLLVVVTYFLFKGSNNTLSISPMMERDGGIGFNNTVGVSSKMVSDTMMYPAEQYAPRPDITDRKMVSSSYYSLLVKNVTESLEGIKSKIGELKGYIVDINISRPELGETATVVFRVPSNQVDTITNYLRAQSIKVVSENVSGYDVTDQYTDVQEYLTILSANKKRLQEILTSAKTVEEILQVQTQIFSVQAQIDSYKGQLKYLEGTTSTALVTAYLSTDEIGLPYTEPLSWRPEVIFKLAVRSMIGTLQGLGGAMIWLGVYSVLIVPALTIVLIVMMVVRKKHKSQE